MIDQINTLVKALEAGSYNSAPSALSQGSALQSEDLSTVMENVTFSDKHLILKQMISKVSTKSTLVQFNRQLDYGTFGGSAQLEGGIGEEDTSTIVRAVVPMAFYSTTRRVSIAANMIGAFDSVKAEDRAASDAAMKLAADIEFDCFRGHADFSNAGIFDGAASISASLPGMVGLDAQVRLSDALSNTQDLMFAEYGSNQSVILPINGTLTQTHIEDAAVKASMNHGNADKLVLDPKALSDYNKISQAKERIVLAGSAQGASGANLREQWTSAGTIALQPSRFLSGKTQPARARSVSPAAPTFSGAHAANAYSILEAGSYSYYVTAANTRGESVPSAAATVAASAGDAVTLTIAPVSGAVYFNVYRSPKGGSAASAKFIGRVAASAGNTSFVDLGNKIQGASTGYLIQTDTMQFHELAPYSRLKLAVTSLALPEAHYEFTSLAVRAPRKTIIMDNIQGL